MPADKMVLFGMPRRDPSKLFKTLGMLGSCNDWLHDTRNQRRAGERD